MLLNLNKKVWRSVADKTNSKLENSVFPNNVKIINNFNDIDIICSLGGGFFGSYSTINTKLNIIIGDINEELYKERIELNKEIQNRLEKFRSGKIFLLEGSICIQSNGIINNEELLTEFILLGKTVVKVLA